MTKVKLADSVVVGVCECCGDISVGLYRSGKLYAVFAPTNAEEFSQQFAEAMKESKKIIASKMN